MLSLCYVMLEHLSIILECRCFHLPACLALRPLLPIVTVVEVGGLVLADLRF
jgi:hypothetical protein